MTNEIHNLRIAERDWQGLRRLFATSFRTQFAPETGAIGVLGSNATVLANEYLVSKIFWPEPADLKVAKNQSIVFDASYIRRAHLHMRSNRLAGLVMFHTHPMADLSVSFSQYDDQQEPQLVANLRELEPSTLLVSVVAGIERTRRPVTMRVVLTRL